MYSRRADCELFYDRRESVGSGRSSMRLGSDCGYFIRNGSVSSSSSEEHYNPTLRLLQIPRSSNGSLGFHLTRSKWDPYPWISAVDANTPAKFYGLKAGECVLEVNGEDVLGMRLSEIVDLVNSDNKTIDKVALLLWNPGSDNNCNTNNLCCGPMPLNLERLTAFTQTMLAIIECPVCLETMSPPILQCQNGHILCVQCRILSHSCPVCRQHFYPGRSLVAEQIYNSIMVSFNLRNITDKSQGHRDPRQLLGFKYKRSSSISSSSSSSSVFPKKQLQRQHGKQQHKFIGIEIDLKPPSPEVNKFESLRLTSNKFLTKLLDRAYSTDNLSSPCCQVRIRCRRRLESVPVLSLTNKTFAENVDGCGKDIDGEFFLGKGNNGETDTKANRNSANAIFEGDEQLELKNVCIRTTSSLSKQFSLSALDLSTEENVRSKAIEQECVLKYRPHRLWLSNDSLQMAILPQAVKATANSSSLLCRQKLSTGRLENCREKLTKKMSCCTKELAFLCPFSCGKQFSGAAIQQHVKVDHSTPILCYNSSSAEFALPLRAPLDRAAVLLMCDGKDFWIKLRTDGKEENITTLALFQGSVDESSDFFMETRLENRPTKDPEVESSKDNYHPSDDGNIYSDNNDDYVKIVVNNDNGILERELITRSIVRSMNVATWKDYTCCGADEGNVFNEKNESRNSFYNEEIIGKNFKTKKDFRNLFLKIVIKKK